MFDVDRSDIVDFVKQPSNWVLIIMGFGFAAVAFNIVPFIVIVAPILGVLVWMLLKVKEKW